MSYSGTAIGTTKKVISHKQQKVYKLYIKLHKMFFHHFDMENIWVAGGCLREYFQGNVNFEGTDIDFFGTDEKFMKEFYRHVVTQYNSVKQYENEFAWHAEVTINNIVYDLDFIKIYFSDQQQCIDSFDYTINQFSMSQNKFLCKPEAWFDLEFNRLVRTGKLEEPTLVLSRLQKFIRKGYHMDGSDIQKIVDQIRTYKYKKNMFLQNLQKMKSSSY